MAAISVHNMALIMNVLCSSCKNTSLMDLVTDVGKAMEFCLLILSGGTLPQQSHGSSLLSSSPSYAKLADCFLSSDQIAKYFTARMNRSTLDMFMQHGF